MGNRYFVELTVLSEHKSTVQAALEKELNTCDPNYSLESISNGTLTYFQLDEISDGDIQCLFDLDKQGIPYEVYSSEGDIFLTSRFTADGERQVISVAISAMNLDLTTCKNLLNTSDALVDYIKNHIDSVTPLPWDNQEEYGKKYRVTQLLLSGASCAQ